MAWSALFGAVLASVVNTPAYAEPLRPYTAPGNPGNAPGTPATVPDAGSRPAPAGQLRLPGAATTPATSFLPAAAGLPGRIEKLRVAVATAGEQLLRIKEDRTQASAQVTVAASHLQLARAELTRAKAAADVAAAESLKDAAALPPGTFGSDLHGLGALSRMQRGESGQQAAARELALAEAAERAADADHTAAVSREQALVTQYTTVDATRLRDEQTLRELQRENSDELARYTRQREAENQRLGAGYLTGSTAGQAADPRALAAVRYALAQLGDKYVWAAEGPDQFDCSGLMLAAYRIYAGNPYPLPRVSRDQYYATRQNQVDRGSMLPGDLIFFSSSSSWTGIHHVGMYVGNGKMVHAPNSQEPVQVSTIWWSEFFAATRVFGSVPATGSPSVPSIPAPVPRPQPGPRPIPTPSAKPGSKPRPTPSAKPTKSVSPSTSPSPSVTPSESTSPSPSVSPSPSPSPSVSAAATSVTPSVGGSSAGSSAGSPG